jgi:cellulose synthase (UDP-forming)
MNVVKQKEHRLFFIKISVLAIISICFYLIVRISTIVNFLGNWYEILLMLILLLVELQIMTFATGYFLNVLRVISYSNNYTMEIPKPKLESFPPVAVIVPSYKEPLSVLRQTLVCFYNLSYPNKQLFLLDDTRYELPWDTPENKLKYRQDLDDLCKELGINIFRSNWHGAKAGIINDFNAYISGKVQEDFVVTHFSENKSTETPKYFIVFDADMNPLSDFVDYLVDIMEKNPKVAFVQTPQYYTNFEFNRVAWASGLQQAIFYEYICEGKHHQNAMFCCGTNVIFRREAFDDVGGFDENSLTEDFATSLRFHRKGWQTIYFNKISAFGMGPEDLGAFFTQQFRWARGTLGVLRTLPKELYYGFHKYSLNQCWEYFLSSSHYLTGLTFFILIYFPILYIFLDIPSYVADPTIYLSSFVPYVSLSLLMYVWPLKKRNYRIREIVSVLAINALTFPIFIRAAFSTLFNLKAKFSVTPKEKACSLSLWFFKVQIITALMCIVAIVWGLQRMYYEKDEFYALFFNIFWTMYNFLMISTFLYFNHEEKIQKEI